MPGSWQREARRVPQPVSRSGPPTCWKRREPCKPTGDLPGVAQGFEGEEKQAPPPSGAAQGERPLQELAAPWADCAKARLRGRRLLPMSGPEDGPKGWRQISQEESGLLDEQAGVLAQALTEGNLS